ncbi:MAG: hypothetical protein AAGF87_15620 [Bacteroidota bacterium]
MYTKLSIPIREDISAIEQLKHIAEGDMDTYFADIILDRAESYYNESGWTIEKVIHQQFRASVWGTREYQVSLDILDNHLAFDCSCPYEAPCKHLAAFIWLLTDEWLDEFNACTKPADQSALRKHLITLSKEELISLVEQFAPLEYRREIELASMNKADVSSAFENEAKKIYHFLAEDEHYDPDEFERKLIPELNKLIPFFKSEQNAIVELIGYLFERLQYLTNEGQLYHSYYDSVFDETEVINFCGAFILAQSAEKRGPLFDKVENIIKGYDYMYTSHNLGYALVSNTKNAKDLNGLQTSLIDAERLKQVKAHEAKLLFERFSDQISSDEKRELSLALASVNLFYATQAADSLIISGENHRAKKLLESELFSDENQYDSYRDEAFEKYIELCLMTNGKKGEQEAMEKYLSARTIFQTLAWCEERRPDLTTSFRDLMEKVSTYNLAIHLINKEEANEVNRLFKQYPDDYRLPELHYKFYYQYGEQFPSEAQQLAWDMLDKSLPHADQREYKKVVQALDLLRLYGEAEQLAIAVKEIRSKHKRRRKLMAMMDEARFS